MGYHISNETRQYFRDEYNLKISENPSRMERQKLAGMVMKDVRKDIGKLEENLKSLVREIKILIKETKPSYWLFY